MRLRSLIILVAAVVFLVGAAFAQPGGAKTAEDHNRLGLQQANRNEHTAAVASYSKCVALDPKHRECFYNRGYAYWEMKKFAEAEKDFSRAIALKPNDAAAYNMRGTTFYQRGMYAEAVDDYNKTVAIDPKRVTAYYNRGLSHYYLKNYLLAKKDFNRVLAITPGDTDALYQRGKVRSETEEKFGAIADLKAVLKIDPSHQKAKTLLASLELQPETAPTKLPSLSEALAKKNGDRMELIGTGLSVQSPAPFQLKQDKADPLIENQTANVFWTLDHKDIFANVRYVKETGGKTPRQDLESMAKLMSEMNNVPIPRIVDITFLGQPAVQYEEEFVDAYDPKKVKRKRKMLAYGSAGEITSFQISYPMADATAATIADQIFKSFQKAGTVAESVLKMPPANWQYVDLRGLRFEVPDAKAAKSCGVKVTGPTAYDSAPVCYEWGGNTIVRAEYRSYNVPVPTPELSAQMYITSAKQLDIDTKSTAARTYTIETATIAGAEAVKVKAYSGYGSVGTNEEVFFIRRGSAFWMVHTYEFIRWNYTRDAVKRIATSMGF